MKVFKEYHPHRAPATTDERQSARHYAALAWHPVGKMVKEWMTYANRRHYETGAKLKDSELTDWVVLGVGIKGLLDTNIDGLDKRTVHAAMDEAIQEESA